MDIPTTLALESLQIFTIRSNKPRLMKAGGSWRKIASREPKRSVLVVSYTHTSMAAIATSCIGDCHGPSLTIRWRGKLQNRERHSVRKERWSARNEKRKSERRELA